MRLLHSFYRKIRDVSKKIMMSAYLLRNVHMFYFFLIIRVGMTETYAYFYHLKFS